MENKQPKSEESKEGESKSEDQNEKSEKIEDEWAKDLTDDFVSVELADDEIFVLGDQRNLSTSDSRTLGPIKYEECWKLKVRYWPYHRFKIYE